MHTPLDAHSVPRTVGRLLLADHVRDACPRRFRPAADEEGARPEHGRRGLSQEQVCLGCVCACLLERYTSGRIIQMILGLNIDDKYLFINHTKSIFKHFISALVALRLENIIHTMTGLSL